MGLGRVRIILRPFTVNRLGPDTLGYRIVVPAATSNAGSSRKGTADVVRLFVQIFTRGSQEAEADAVVVRRGGQWILRHLDTIVP
jgi:hypothetical protein